MPRCVASWTATPSLTITCQAQVSGQSCGQAPRSWKDGQLARGSKKCRWRGARQEEVERMVNRLLHGCLPGKGQHSPSETTKVTALHIEIGTLLKTDFDRAYSPVWTELLELINKRRPVGRITIQWHMNPRMQVPANAHNFCLGTQALPLPREIASHPAVAISPLVYGLIVSLIEAEQVPIAVRRKYLTNEREHLCVSTAIGERMRKELRHCSALRSCQLVKHIPFIPRDF